jgi:tRNA A-37 threonylcarbamoyl transferase component Bud32
MNAAEWSRVNGIFAAALDLASEERSQFLGRECGANREERREVERLLAEHERSSGMLDRPLFAATPQIEEEFATGHVLASRYRIERLIARGGMASVYLARDQQVADRRVIVKFLHAWARQYAWLKSKFRQEMEALARIDHHSVVGVLDAGETSDGLPFLVIEYIDGATLRSEMQRGAMDLARVAGIIGETGSAVAAAHAKGVLHRDLKPENIMLEEPGSPQERVRLIDFGIARLEGPEIGMATQITQFAGTTAYMAPEQLRGKPTLSSDIYTIGVIAYEMLAGGRPFAAATPVELYEQQRGGAKAEPLRRRQEIPEPAVRLILKQLSFRAEDRSASAREAGEGIAAALVGPAGRIWSRRRAAAVAMGGAAAIAGGGYTWWSRAGDALSSSERVIELPPATEPLEHGFRPDGAIEYRVISNPDATAFDAVRITSSEQGWYSHGLNRAQSLAASRRGWRIIFEAKVEEGSLSCMIDHQHASQRYALNLFRTEGGPDVARLVTAAVPVTRGLEWPIPGPSGERHQLVMALKPPGETTELWVDGVKRLTGGSGMGDFRYRRGLEFGLIRYHSVRAAGVVWKVRLEIG